MSDVQTWSTTAASNNSASPDGFPEGMAPSGVNDSAREVMAALAKYRSDTDGVNTTTGSANAYVLAASRTMTAYAQGDLFTFKANFSNTGPATINVDSLGAKNIFAHNSALVGYEIISGGIYTAIYDGTQFQLQGPQSQVIDCVEATPYNTHVALSTVIPLDDSIPQNTEGSELVSASITPKSASNRLLIEWDGQGYITNAGTVIAALFQDSTADALAVSYDGGTAGDFCSLRGRYEMAAGTTSSTTFKVRVGPSVGTGSIYVTGTDTGRKFSGLAKFTLRVTELRP